MIFLNPFPESGMVSRWRKLPPPHIKQEYTRAGATHERKNGWWVRTFTPESLRNFYLYDVLPHEIGHHVERHHAKRKGQEACQEKTDPDVVQCHMVMI